MNILETLENLNVSEECFENVLNIVECILEDYKSFKEQKQEDGSSQAYKELASVDKSIRRNKTKALKGARKEYGQARKEELAWRGKGWLQQFKNISDEEKALDKLKKAREEEKDAQEEVDKDLRRADAAKEFEERSK